MKRRVSTFLLSLALVLGVASMVATPVDAATVVPPHSMPAGASYGQWAASWWQWLLQTPVSLNPEFRPPGTPTSPQAVDCSVGQSGRVWFIGGTFLPTSSTPETSRSDVYRTCTVPAGKLLFFPILNSWADNLGCPNTDFSAAQLQAFNALDINSIVPGSMSATIDGASVPGLIDGNSKYRSPSPWFSYTLPADNIGQLFGCDFPAGTTPPPVDGHPGATSDGIYLMLRPLSAGTHVIHFGGEFNIPGTLDFIQNINYTITVG